MRTISLILSAAALLASGAARPASGHHAFSAEFDIDKPMTIEGTIAQMEWINPHAWLHVDVPGDGGEVTRWMIELGPPNSLIKRGWNRDSIKPGLQVTVEGHQAIDGGHRANGASVVLPDGTALFGAGSSPNDPDNQ